jgi:sugar phosphate permease
MTLVAAAIVTLILALLAFWILGDEKEEEDSDDVPTTSGQKIGILETAKLIFGSISFWQIAAPAFCRYGTLVSLQGLWLGLYLMDVEGYSPIRTGNMLIMLAVGMAAGSPCAGWLCDRIFHSKKSIILLGLILYCLSLFPLVGVFKIRYTFLYAIIYFVIGFFSGFGMLLYSHVKEIFPSNVSGTAMAWVNFFTIAGGAFFTQLMGRIIEYFPHTGQSYPPGVYHLSFLLCFVCMGASIIFYAFCKEK